jgi:hypothetical protein
MSELFMTEYYNYLLPGEKPNAELILKRMNEYDKCLITGDTEDLTILPVDFDLANILPSNMARVSKKFVAESPIVVDYSRNFIAYEHIVGIEFRSCIDFYNHNTAILDKLTVETLISQKERDFISSEGFPSKFTGNALAGIFETLTSLHVKGISKVSIQDFTLEWSSFQSYMMGVLDRKKSKSNIVRPMFGL